MSAKRVLAVDPGDAHVGVAGWIAGGEVRTREARADEFLAEYTRICDVSGQWGMGPLVVVCEAFVLYPTEAGAQSWSPMLTSQMIGAMKWVAQERDIEFIEQGANIKKPTRGHLRAMGIRQVGKSVHERDAELHLYHYLFHEELIRMTPKEDE